MPNSVAIYEYLVSVSAKQPILKRKEHNKTDYSFRVQS